MKKVLIIGGAGFFGYHLINKLLKYNYIIDVVDNLAKIKKDDAINQLIKNKKVNFFKLDLTKISNLKNFQEITIIFLTLRLYLVLKK